MLLVVPVERIRFSSIMSFVDSMCDMLAKCKDEDNY